MPNAKILFLFLLFILMAAVTHADQRAVLFLGDTSFGDNYQEKLAEMDQEAPIKENGYAYTLENFQKILINADLVIANFESTLSNFKETPFPDKFAIHKDNPEMSIETFQRHNMNVFTLANNHTLDYGRPGLEKTMEHFTSNGIVFFGAGETEEEAARPYFFEIKTKPAEHKFAVIGAFEYSKRYDEEYGFFATEEKSGTYALDVPKITAQIKRIKKVEPDRFVIIFPHWGKNYRWVTKEQKDAANRLIEAGADAIIGHGAHMIQEFEYVRNKLVIYSLGNFIFGSNSRNEEKNAPPYSFIAKVMIESTPTKKLKLRLYPIHTDNNHNGYQPRFVTERELSDIADSLKGRRSGKRIFKYLKSDNDAYGPYFEMTLTRKGF